MAEHSFTKPYRVDERGARQLEQMLAAPSPLVDFCHKPKRVSVDELSRRYAKPHR